MFDGVDTSGLADLDAPALTWDFIDRLRGLTRMKIVLKGIVTREDAKLAVDRGVDGIIVSNHGGRAEESARGTIESLPEVVEQVNGRIPVLIDSGFRRGTDLFKALALGADAIAIGRPYLWGLAAFGQPGVEAVLEILRKELALAMRLAGATSIQAITPDFVVSPR
jgi:(S)-2-hydroxy-acid oxidase